MYTIYCHIFPNGKRYVGLTKNSTEKRFGSNGGNYKGCVLVDRAITKYGWENVKHVVLDTAETKTSAEEKERYYIRFYDSDNPENGYNMLPGGDVSDNAATEEMRHKLGNGWRGKHRTEEEKEKIGAGVRKKFEREESNGHFGLRHSDNAKEKMSRSQTERWKDEKRRESASERMAARMSDPEYKERIVKNLDRYRRKPGDWKMPDEAKEKLSKHFSGKWLGENSSCSKPVLQFDKDGNLIRRWANAGEVERAGIAGRRSVGNCCLHKPHYYTAGGYKWEYESG